MFSRIILAGAVCGVHRPQLGFASRQRRGQRAFGRLTRLVQAPASHQPRCNRLSRHRRDVNGCYRSLQEAAERAGSAARDSILIAPQFLDEDDIRANRLPAAALSSAGIHLRYVIADPSSYLYFSDERPAPFRGASCRNFNRWKYGPIDPPAYVKADAANTWPRLEAQYVQRDVIYLLGDADIDPHQKDLDTSCGAEAQGRTRFVRGQAYFAYLHARHPSGWSQRMWFVPGVAHSGRKMITSTCGVNAIFDTGTCPDQ